MAKPKNTATKYNYGEGAFADNRWFLDEFKDIRAERVMAVAGKLWKQLEPTRNRMFTCERMYDDMASLGLSPRRYRQRSVFSNWHRPSLNGCKAVVDTYVALLTKDRPRISVITSGARQSVQRKARFLEQFGDGVMYEDDFHDKSTDVVYDQAIYGTGVEFFYENDDDPKHIQAASERVPPHEMLADDQATYYGKPDEIMRLKWVEVFRLQKEYPEKAEELEHANSSAFDDAVGTAEEPQYGTVRLIPLVSAWKCASKAGPGRYSYVAGNVILEDEPYNEFSIPFEFSYRQRPRAGIFGKSLVDEVAGIQKELNILVQRVQRSIHLLGAGHWMIEEGSKVNTSHIDNQIGSISRYKGTMPHLNVVDPVPPQVFAQIDRLWMKMFEVIGISPQAAQGQVPANIHSAKGQLVYADVQSQRFQPSYREYQSFYLRSMRQFIRLARRISEHDKNFAVKAVGKEMMQAVKWADANLEEEEYALRLYATNALEDDPVGRIEQASNLVETQMVPPKKGLRLLMDMPDLKAFFNEEFASERAIDICIETIFDKGKYKAPEPMMDLASGITRMQNAYLEAWGKEDADPKRLANAMRWIAQAKSQQAKAAAPPPPPPGAQPGPPPPGAPPMPPPGMPGPLNAPPANLNGAPPGAA